MQQFSMNPDPASWVELVNGALAFDQYPDGSFQFRVTRCADVAPVYEVVLKSTLPAAIIAAGQVIDALEELGRSQPFTVITRLIVQTLPDQRGDKQGKPGASIPARVSARMLAAIDADEIVVHDPHSPYMVGALRRFYEGQLHVISPLECFNVMARLALANNGGQPLIADKEPKVVAVDAGARGRALEWAKAYNADLIQMDKARNADGVITGHKFSEDDPMSLLLPMRRDSEVWVIDDLCDGGATFISVAKALRAEFPDWNGPLHLFVTHGLFSKGRAELHEHFNSVRALFSYDDWR